MREIRTSGSEGGGVEPNRPSLPLSGATATALPALDSRFRGNDEEERQLVEISGFILGQPLRGETARPD